MDTLLKRLRERDIRLWTEDGQLRYSAPKGAITPELLAELRDRKADIIAFLDRARHRHDSPLPVEIPVSARDGAPLPLSFAQQRLWFLDQLEGASATYNVPAAMRLRGPLDVAALQQALQNVVARHDTLRTRFAVVAETPVQAVLPALELALPVTDLQGVEAQAAEVVRLARLDMEQPFDLARGPLIRAGLLKLAAEEHVLLLCLHHIISDGWSIGVLAREMSLLYAAADAPLPPLRLQYADYALWQQAWLSGEILDHQLAYWKKQLADMPALLELPTDHPRPPQQGFRGGSVAVQVEAELTARLKQLAQTHDATLYIVLLTAFAVLLMRYSNQNDVAIGSPIANRRHRDLEGLIGFFVNTLVLRLRAEETTTFEELLRVARQTALEAYAHQDVPFEQLVNALQPQRSLSHSPLFQVMFVLQNAPPAPLQLPGLTLEPLDLEVRTAKFDMLLSLEESAHGLKGWWEYNSDLFERATIERMLGHWLHLLAAVADNVHRRVALIPLLALEERRQLLLRWNATRQSFDNLLPHQRLEILAEEHPEHAAVVCGEHNLSYQALNGRANQLAHYLTAAGVGSDSLVALCAERSLDLMVAVVAVLKAGGAYVPLDPAYPRERLALMLEDAHPKVLLTQHHLRDKLPLPPHTQVLCLDTDWAEVANHSLVNPVTAVRAGESLGYVIYTSGSTGKPKGVAMRYRALANLIAWQLRVAGFLPKARVIQFSPISFDVSFQELFSTWGSGGTLYLIDDEQRRNSEFLLHFLADNQIQRLFLPFVALHNLAEAAQSAAVLPEALCEVITAGEQLQTTPALVHLFERLPHCTLHNHYGPSETHVVTAYTLQGPPAAWPALPPVGVPIANSEAYILDKYLQPVPVGVAGELYLAGSCLARGYLHRPDLTAERFVKLTLHKQQLVIMPEDQNPLLTETCILVNAYKTGDGARWLADGNIEFLGRLDNQVKIRGFRVELGEIETALQEHPEVRAAAVTVQRDARAGARLVAYIVSALTPDRLGHEENCLLKCHGAKVQAVVEDISNFGLGLSEIPALEGLAAGVTVQIHLTLPGEDEPLWLGGKVAWYAAPRAGIKFDLSDDEQARMNHGIEYLRETRRHFKVLQRTVASSLRDFLESKFPDYMIPGAYILLDRLPLTPSGKVDRRALPRPDKLQEEEKTFTAPRDTLEMQLTGIWESLLGVHPLGIHDDFFDKGGHSLLAVRLVGQIKQKLRREVPLSTLFQNPTVAQLAHLLRRVEEVTETASPVLVPVQPHGERPPLFWVHAVGGNVLSYAELARELGDEQPFYAFQSPGLDGKQPMLATIEEMAACYVAAMRTLQPAGPYQVGGWSFGGLVAFEMARQLEQQGEEVHMLAMLDIWTTIAQHLENPDDEAEYVRVFARYLSGLFGQKATLLLDDDQPLTLAVQLPHMLKQAQLLNMLPPELALEDLEVLVEVFRNNLRAAAAYEPQVYNGMAVLFRAAEKPRIRIPDINLGWGKYVKGGIINHVLPGDHYAMLRKPVVGMLAEALESYVL